MARDLKAIKNRFAGNNRPHIAHNKGAIARRLRLDAGGLVPASRNVEGVVEMMLDATQHHVQELTPSACSAGTPPFFLRAAAGCTG